MHNIVHIIDVLYRLNINIELSKLYVFKRVHIMRIHDSLDVNEHELIQYKTKAMMVLSRDGNTREHLFH